MGICDTTVVGVIDISNSVSTTGLNGTITKALVPCLEQYGEKEILNRSSLMVQAHTMFWLQQILSHGLLSPQICWQNSTSPSSQFCENDLA